ncbi:bifunctional protein FolD isoform X1 [Dermacentor andersoni]|uniref:bifunctional protein FolD isoform X1 n=1 Tax=Dermacentor andersoni TaxID=34620 RepID=UPI002155E0AC|nr:bifunctional protein FolD-like isoform X1 [Dermacentor andersoni]
MHSLKAPRFIQFARNCSGSAHKATPLELQASRTAEVIDGKRIAREIEGEIRTAVDDIYTRGGRRPQLTAVLVGDNEGSSVYVKNKIKAAKRTGIGGDCIHLPSTTTQAGLLEVVQRLNNCASVDGILVQLPLPSHIEESVICNAVLPSKDVDGFHALQMGRLCLNMASLAPCTPLAIVEILQRIGISTYGKHVLVCGRSTIVGLPLSIMLGSSRDYGNATVSSCHSRSRPSDLKALAKMADIVITATGVPGLITADMIKDGACVIDVGITRVWDEASGKTKLVGDVDFPGVSRKASFITPVPGGVGPVTVAMLMRNTFLAYSRAINY